MKNKEKFAKEIVEIAVNCDEIAVDKNGNLTTCKKISCEDCAFKHPEITCYEQTKKWAESEYVEPKIFTEEEKAILRALPKANWVARDRDGRLFFYQEKPQKGNKTWEFNHFSYIVLNFLALGEFTDAKFSVIKWEDAEPTSREDILR